MTLIGLGIIFALLFVGCCADKNAPTEDEAVMMLIFLLAAVGCGIAGVVR